MKLKLLLPLITLLFSLTALAQETKFSSTSDGYDWNKASITYRLQYSELMANANKSFAPSITAKVIYDSLQAFYDTNDPELLAQPIVQTVALTVAAYAKME